jgi:hypothetical protein
VSGREGFQFRAPVAVDEDADDEAQILGGGPKRRNAGKC